MLKYIIRERRNELTRAGAAGIAVDGLWIVATWLSKSARKAYERGKEDPDAGKSSGSGPEKEGPARMPTIPCSSHRPADAC